MAAECWSSGKDDDMPPVQRPVQQKCPSKKFGWVCLAVYGTTWNKHTYFFSHSHLHLADIIQFLISYAEGQSLWKCAQYAGVNYGSTAVDWGSFCRDLSVEYYVCNIRHVYSIQRGNRNGRVAVWPSHKISSRPTTRTKGLIIRQ